MAEKIMYIPNDDTQNCPFDRLQIEVEMFRHSTHQSKFNKSPQSW